MCPGISKSPGGLTGRGGERPDCAGIRAEHDIPPRDREEIVSGSPFGPEDWPVANVRGPGGAFGGSCRVARVIAGDAVDDTTGLEMAVGDPHPPIIDDWRAFPE